MKLWRRPAHCGRFTCVWTLGTLHTCTDLDIRGGSELFCVLVWTFIHVSEPPVGHVDQDKVFFCVCVFNRRNTLWDTCIRTQIAMPWSWKKDHTDQLA